AGSLNLVMGYAGVLSIMHAAFFGIGAYGAARVVVSLGVPFPLDLVAGFVLTALSSVAIGASILRLGEWYVIMSTLALQLVLSSVFLNWQDATGGSYGIYGIPRPFVFGVQVISLPGFALLAAVVATICFLFLWLVVHSPFGLALKGLRDDDLLAQSFGKDVLRQRLVSLALGSGLAGVAGGVYARFVGYIDPSTFDISQSLSIITILVVGGLGNLWGALGGSILLVTVPQVLRFTPVTSQAVANIQLLLFGVLLIVVLRLRPEGLIKERPAVRAGAAADPAASGDRRGFQRLDHPSLEMAHVDGADHPSHEGALLEIDRVYKSFGGLMAVNNLSLSILPGIVTAIIGPNGAGKTTLFNMITGYLQPDRGRISYDGHDLTHMRPFELARLGIARSFQDVRVFPKMTVLENLVLALQGDDIERL
ncbi:MAG: ATP-binding cassette domain-containing protein, partial [Dehalococcoidia bacterium]|nr:ATP-binding cassette domain-containing protein [Dehalococcoidia bacterium]